MTHTTEVQPDTAPSHQPIIGAAAIGAAVAVALGVYGNVHDGTGDTITTFWFPNLLSMKAWFATVAVVLGIGQLTSAMWMYGRLPGVGDAPGWLAPAHRWLGTAAFVFTLPVAYHCLWSLGFKSSDTRVLVHSVLGCAFYGAFTTKMLVLRSDRMPTWALPLVGGVLVSVLTGIWLVTSLWYFTNVGFPGV